MNADVVSLLERDPTIAVVGATDEPGKYGGIIYRNLKRKGFRVVPINPGRETVDGDPTFASVTQLDPVPDIVNIVLPPGRTVAVLDEVAQLEHAAVWIQPGAADPSVRDKVDKLGLPAIIDACIMVATQTRSDEGSDLPDHG